MDTAESGVPLELADELYGLPLGEFTARRDALAKEHKADRALAARIKALRKPSVAAWAVNLFARREAEQLTELLGVGTALRDAQAALDADQLREFTRQRRQLTARVTTAVRRTAREEGQSLTPAVADQVEATLTAAMLDAGAAEAVASGMLTRAMAAAGMDAVEVGDAVALPEALGFVATPREVEPPGRPDLHVVPDPDADAVERARARERVDAARSAHRRAADELAEAEADVERLQARGLQLQSEVDELRRRLADLESDAEENDDELSDAEEVRAEASEVVDAATADLTDAEAALSRLGEG